MYNTGVKKLIFSNLVLNSEDPIYLQIEKHIKVTITNGIL